MGVNVLHYEVMKDASSDMLFGMAGDSSAGIRLESLKEFSRSALYLTGLSVGEVPPTPDAYGMSLSPHVSDHVIASIASCLGFLTGYQGERDGSLIQDVYPVRSDARAPVNSGSARRFDFHTENAHHEVPPDVLGLMCLRGGVERAVTELVDVEGVWQSLPDEDREMLMNRRYRTRPGLSFRRARTESPRPTRHAIRTRTLAGPVFRFNSHNTEGVDPESDQAYRRFLSCLPLEAKTLRLSAGEVVLVDNTTVAHARRQFRARFDGADRWLRRFYVLRRSPGRHAKIVDGGLIVA